MWYALVAPLETISQTTYTFTNAGATGRLGPTQAQINTVYQGTNLAGKVTINTQGIQEWTIPYSGKYRIEAYGASGGNSQNHSGGKGAKILGVFSLDEGETLSILVGQKGIDGRDGGSNANQGGGGGSFIWKKNLAINGLLIAAGGGGGAGLIDYAYKNANSTTTANDGFFKNTHNSPISRKGETGYGGYGGDGNNRGVGGAGWLGNSQDGGVTSNFYRKAYSPLNGGFGGYGGQGDGAYFNGQDGGFGGGGGAGAHSFYLYGGGGGGYTGGGGASWDYYNSGPGGGGGSYNSGESQENVGGYNIGDGFIVITELSSGGTISSTTSVFCTSSVNPDAFVSEAPANGGTGTFSYQWQESTDGIDYTDIVGATSLTYDPGVISQTTFYRRKATNSLELYSNVLELEKFEITTEPSSSSQLLLLNATPTDLSVSVSNVDGVTYQWYKNSTNSNSGGTAISGATGATYTPPTSQVSAWYYYVVVSNSSCNIASDVSGPVIIGNGNLEVVASGGGQQDAAWFFDGSKLYPLIDDATINSSDLESLVTSSSSGVSIEALGNVTISDQLDLTKSLTINSSSLNIDANLFSSLSSGDALIFNTKKITQTNSGTQVTSSGGNIIYKALNSSFTSNSDRSILLESTTIDANGGNILIESDYASTGSHSGSDSDRVIGMGGVTIQTTGTGTITVKGDATNNTNTGNTWGMQLVTTQFQTQSGAIVIEGISGKNSNNARGLAVDGSTFKVFSASGPISIIDKMAPNQAGNYNGLYLKPNVSGAIVFGANDASTSSSDIAISQNLTSTASGEDILLKSSGSINVASDKSIQTNNGDIIYWADSDIDNEGAISLGDNVTLNSANGSTTSNLSGGGKIVLAGGADDGANDGTASDGIPDGFASSSTGNGIKLSASTENHTQMYSGGGNIIIRGLSNHDSPSDNRDEVGIWHQGSWTANSGNGSIDIIGISDKFYGVNFVRVLSYSITGPKLLSLTSNKAVGAAITISGTSSTSHGVVFNYDNPKEILATGGGDIVITGAGAGSGYGIFLQNQDILATTGAIILNAGAKGIYTANAGMNLGRKVGSPITISSSDIRLIADRLEFVNTANLSTSGKVTIESNADSFTGVLTFPVDNLTLSNDVSGLTLGKATNTVDITVSNATTIAGPITIYGSDLTFNAALTATDKPHLYASGGFAWKLNNTISLEPAFLYRMVSDAPNQVTAIGKINFKDQLQLGVGVSNNDYISAMLAFKGMELFDFGYGYEMGQRTSSTALRANTHELFLRFKFSAKPILKENTKK